jgi:DtxR family Mn-dependent transcriptional regulator
MSARRQPNSNSESVDNYLKAILTLGGPEEKRVATNALARRLDVAPASVTDMLQKLATGLPSFVQYERHHGVLLSSVGKKRALEVVRQKDSIPLTDVTREGIYVVDSVSDHNARILKLVKDSGIAPGVRLRVRERPSIAGCAVSIGGSSKLLNLQEDAANSIRVCPLRK